jgi:hypothetical protein
MLFFFVDISFAFLTAENDSLPGPIGEAEQFFNIFTGSRFKISREEVPAGRFIEKGCCPLFIATKVIGTCPTGKSRPAALVAVDEVKRRFSTISTNEDVPHEKIPVTKASVMHASYKVAQSPVDGKQLILFQLFLDSKIKKTVTVYNTLSDKELVFQEAKDPILCGDEGTHSGEAPFSQLEEIMKFPDARSASPGSR